MQKKILLRINQNMWEDIERWAQDEFRSINGQIEYILKTAIENRKKESKNGTDRK